MFERFTDRARRVVVLAQEYSRLLNADHIGSVHILLGLAKEGEGIAAQVLTELGFDADKIADELSAMKHIGPGMSGHIPFTQEAKRVIEFSLREALQLGHNYIGTEHVLLGCVRDDSSEAYHFLLNRVKLTAVDVRKLVLDKLASYNTPGGESERYLEVIADIEALQAKTKGLHADIGNHLHLAKVAAEDWAARKLLAEAREERKG